MFFYIYIYLKERKSYISTHPNQNQEVISRVGILLLSFMSLRYLSRVACQAGMRVLQGIKEQASKYDLTFKTLKDSTCGSSASSSSSKQARKLSTGAIDSSSISRAAAKNDKLKQAEESLRMVMFLSCWGPN